MIKKLKETLVVTSLLTLSPMLVGILLWNRLPEEIATHFDRSNAANGWSSKPFAVFGLPLLMLVIHLLCSFAIVSDPKRKNIHARMFRWIMWLIPLISLITCLTCYVAALGYEINISMIIQILVGAVFIIVGNYLHKLKQNFSVGIRLPWTLHSEENWNRTHRAASWIWIVCGVLMILNSILKIEWLTIPAVIVLIAFPLVYSFVLYRRGI